ncbi:MAG: alkane 1-monooxygenase [Bacteroidia bacterium]
MRNYKYLLSLTTGIIVITGNMLGNWWVAGNIIFSLGILAVLEKFVSQNHDNSYSESEIFPDAILFAHVLLQMLCLSSLFYSVSQNGLSFSQIIVAAISTGINSGSSAIVIAHELIHRNIKWFQWAGKFLLFTAGNVYFYVDHLRVHHKWVGTAKDPATSIYGENLYRFFMRTTVGQFKSALNSDANRLRKINAAPYGLRNYVTASILLLVLFMSLLAYFLGASVLVAFMLQAILANFLLEYTNYIEHYGLTRNENERVTEHHSWQSDKVISRYFLIDLSRHADHHYYASKPYHILKSYDKAPVLPGGYVEMIYYALIPPLWFKTMHPLLRKQ